MCKHKNIQASMFTTFNHPYLARCMDCREELIIDPPKHRTTATIGKGLKPTLKRPIVAERCTKGVLR